MKRLMIVSIIFISSSMYGDVASEVATNSSSQSLDHASTNNIDEVSLQIANVHHINLDTTQVDGGGNWLNKRIWYEKAQNVFDEMRNIVNGVADVRLQFSNEVNSVGHRIDSFFESIDFTKGQLDEKFKEILTQLETEQKIIGDLSVADRDLQKIIKQELQVIDQIGKDIHAIGMIDNKIDEALAQAFKTMDECRQYETKSWDVFKGIGKELDDKKARALYYQMSNYKQNIEQKINYLKSSLFPYLKNTLIAKIDANIAKINQAMDDLKKKGVDIEQIMHKNQEEDIANFHKHEHNSIDAAAHDEKHLEIEKTADTDKDVKATKLDSKTPKDDEKKMGYYDQIIDRVKAVLHYGYFGIFFDYMNSSYDAFFASYSYPIVTYVYNFILSLKKYWHDAVDYCMSLFGQKVVKKVQTAGKIIKEEAIKIEEEIEGLTIKKIDEHESDEHLSEKKIIDKVDGYVDKTLDTKSSDKSTEEQKIVNSESQKTEHEKDSQVVKDTVEVQFLSSSGSVEKKQITQSSVYQLFRALLDCIGTMVYSLYACIAQLVKLIWSFGCYVTAGQ